MSVLNYVCIYFFFLLKMFVGPRWDNGVDMSTAQTFNPFLRIPAKLLCYSTKLSISISNSSRIFLLAYFLLLIPLKYLIYNGPFICTGFNAFLCIVSIRDEQRLLINILRRWEKIFVLTRCRTLNTLQFWYGVFIKYRVFSKILRYIPDSLVSLGFPSVSMSAHNGRSNTSAAAAELADFRKITTF